MASRSSARRYEAPRAGSERLASANDKRNIPSLVASLGNFQGYNLNQGDKNTLIGKFRNVWTPLTEDAPPNLQTSISVGGNDPIAGHRFGYLLSGTYSLNEDEKSNQIRALADRGSTPGSTVEINKFSGSSP